MPNPPANNVAIPDPLERTALALTRIELHLDIQYLRIAEIEATVSEIRDALGVQLPRPNNNQLECPIHLGRVAAHRSRILPCGHVFCRECISRWLRDNTTCPLCRSNPFTGEPQQQETQRHNSLHELEANDVQVPTARPAVLRLGEVDTLLTPLEELELPLPALPDVPAEDPRSAAGNDEVEEHHRLAGDPMLIEQIAFHERLVEEIRMLQARATLMIDNGTEVELNTRWRDFLKLQVDEHRTQARVISDFVESLGEMREGGTVA